MMSLEFRYAALLVCILTLLLFSVGCRSSNIPETRNYLLRIVEETKQTPAAKALEVERVELPGYLDRLNIVLEISERELRPARFHVWSEPLRDGVRHTLEQASAMGHSVSPGDARKVEILVDTFHGTEDGRVLFSGSWRLTEPSEPGARNDFRIQVELSEAGYPALVEGHARCLVKLSRQIVDQLEDGS